MGEGFLIDTNVLIYYLSGRLTGNVASLIASGKVSISLISRIELLSYPDADAARQVILRKFADGLVTHGIDDAVVERTIIVRKASRLKLPDAFIAATAMVRGLTLITADRKDFGRVEGLTFLDPASYG
jgi:predicted nucleic acid-binding protein